MSAGSCRAKHLLGRPKTRPNGDQRRPFWTPCEVVSHATRRYVIFLLLLVSLPAFAESNFAGKKATSFTAVAPSQEIPLGEHLIYDVSWMGVPVGLGELWVKEKVAFEGREAYHVIAVASTNDFLSKIYPVRDEVHSWIDAKTLQSLGSEKKASEGNYRADERVVYEEAKKKGFYESLKSGEKKEFDVAVPVHDPISAFYWARRQALEPGKSLHSTVNNGEKDYGLEVDVLRRDATEFRGMGVIDTILIEPKSRLKGLLEKRGRVWVHLKNDPSRTPVRITFKTPFGPITGVLKPSD